MSGFLVGMIVFLVVFAVLFFMRFHWLEKQAQEGNYRRPQHAFDGYRKITKAEKLNQLNKELDQLQRERLQCHNAKCRNGYDHKIRNQKARIAEVRNDGKTKN